MQKNHILRPGNFLHGLLVVFVCTFGLLPMSAQDNTYTETVNGVSFKMVRVQGGTFTMGCREEHDGYCWDWDLPLHRVTLSNYSIGETEVTVGQFKVFIEKTGYETTAEKEGWSFIWDGNDYVEKKGVNWRHDVVGELRLANENDHPVIHVSWEDAMAYCNWLSKKTGRVYRLPTEAEWEYAARGGNKSLGYMYSGSNEPDEVAWNDDNSGSRTHAVKGKKANELGLYDLFGNVWEWCLDWDGEYATGNRTNPMGPAGGSERVIRGGGWTIIPRRCIVSYRLTDSPASRVNYLGFRIACQ
jgi:sulfatase modifying factor 1